MRAWSKIGFSLLLWASAASADDTQKPPPRPVDAEITSDTAAQFYEMRSPSGATVISRRRLMSTLGVSVYDLFDKPQDPSAPTLTFRARLRYDADYGGSAEETALGNSSRFVPGFQRGPVDLMYGYLEGRRYLGGLLSFKLGRQYVTDALGWWSFDGGQVKITTPYYLAAEVYGGLEQRGGLPLSTSRFERDGVWRGDRRDFDPNNYPSFQPNDIAPAFGAALESSGVPWLHGRLTYRRVYNTGSSNVTMLGNGLRDFATYEGTRVSQERVGYALDASLGNVGGIKAGLAYDLYVMDMANIFASVDWYQSQKLTISADYDYYRPTFDGDSIWNFFAAGPLNDLGLRAAWDPSQRVSIGGGLHARAFTVPTTNSHCDSNPIVCLDVNNSSPSYLATANYYPSSKLDLMGGANLSARYRIGEGNIGWRGVADLAQSGDRYGIDIYGERTLENRYVLQGRTGVWHWSDSLRPDRDATNFTYVLGAGYKLFPRSMILADFQHDMNRIAGQRFRAMLWLTIALAK